MLVSGTNLDLLKKSGNDLSAICLTGAGKLQYCVVAACCNSTRNAVVSGGPESFTVFSWKIFRRCLTFDAV